MSDLIRRQDAIKILTSMMRDCFPEAEEELDAVTTTIREIPSAEPTERTAKVIKHNYWLGVSLNVVGEQTIGYEWLCENCKKKVIDEDDYCSHCGAKLDWSE